MVTTNTPVLTAQEQAIAEGKTALYDNVSDRILRMYEAIRAYGPPRVALDRAVLFTESFQQTESQPLVVRWAKALKHYAENAPIAIFDDELIVGRPNTWLGRWGIVYPELDGVIMPDGMKMFRENKGKVGEVVVTDDDARIINDLLTPYWAGKDYASIYHDALPEATRYMVYGPDPKNLLYPTCVVLVSSTMRHSQNWTPDFNKILTRGVKGIREEAQAKLNALTEPRDLIYKQPFLEAVIITCDAMTIWSRRYAQLATEMATKEPNPQRQQELETIAEVCHWVPENPARTFHEALQAQWWGQMFNRIEQTSGAMGQGRMDQYLLPYYQKDVAAGRITPESATELFQCVWIQMAQCVELKLNPVTAAGTEGFSKFEDVCLGGQTADGQDATNELTYLILESTRALQIPVPEPCVRIHANTPDRLLHFVAEVIKDGKGFPKLLNDEMVVPFYLANGATLKIAVVEVLGTQAGWLALQAGMAVCANAILIPEIPYDLQKVATKLQDKARAGDTYGLVVVAEGAVAADPSVAAESPLSGLQAALSPLANDDGGAHVIQRSGAAATTVALHLQRLIDQETYPLVVGPWVKGGLPTAVDRQLGLGYGAAAVGALNTGSTGVMVAFQPPDLTLVPLGQAINQVRTVPADSEFIQMARSLGICLGG